MFQDINNLSQEIKFKQAYFQTQAAQARLAKAFKVAGQSGKNQGQPEGKRAWFLSLPFRLARQPK